MEVPINLLEKIKNSNNILIQAHNKPDGDAIGSMIALGKGLKSLGKEIDYCVDMNFEPKLNFFNEINNFNKNIKDHYDALIIVDCSTPDYSKWPEKKITYDDLLIIDHHKSNEAYGDDNFVRITGACGELVYLVLEKLGVEFDQEMKEAIFTSLSSDTGSFQFSNTTSQTHEIASKLLENGNTYSPISKRLHSQKSLDQLNMYAEAIKSIKLFHNGDIVLLSLPYESIEKFGGSSNVTDDLSNIGMNLVDSKVSVLIKENEPGIQKMSIRSKAPYNIDVSELATKYNGGGHYRAAGASFNGTIEELEPLIIKDLTELIEK